jgi:RHS repeat-associated protein
MWLKWNTPHLWRSGDNVLTVLYHDNAGLLRTKIVGKAGYSPPPDIVVGGTISEGAVTQSGSAASSGGLTGITSSFGNEGENLFATAMSDEGAIINELGWFGLKDSSIQYYKYEYDNAGRINWIGRNHFPYTQFNVANAYQKEERFKHDKMDRLTSVERLYSATFDPLILTWDTLFTTTYNKNLMTSNSIVGNYFYNSSKPHALTKVELSDATTISTNTCDLTYTTFNKVRTISEGDYFYDIKYYPNKQQAVSTLEEDGTVISKKQYAGKAFEIDYATNTKYFYVYAHGLPVAVYIQQGENAIVPYFIHTDHLGSVDKITDSDGNTVDSMSFDAWGNRRNRLDWKEKEGSITHLIDRGFTMHQHLDVFNLINMGGRIYDPVVQQFLSPDPYVQMSDNTQNLNRYAYCLNSPTMYVDPTGEKLKWWQWLLIGLEADALTGGAISAFTTATATGVAGFGGAVYTSVTSTAIAASATLSSIDFLVSGAKSFYYNDPQYIQNWMFLEGAQFVSLFSSPFSYDNNAHWYEWFPQVVNNFTGGEILQDYVGKTLGHALNIGGKIENSAFYKGRLINRTTDNTLILTRYHKASNTQ